MLLRITRVKVYVVEPMDSPLELVVPGMEAVIVKEKEPGR